MHRQLSLWLISFCLLGAFLLPATAVMAAELVDVIDAGDADDPFDMRAAVTYRRSLRRAGRISCHGIASTAQ